MKRVELHLGGAPFATFNGGHAGAYDELVRELREADEIMNIGDAVEPWPEGEMEARVLLRTYRERAEALHREEGES